MKLLSVNVGLPRIVEYNGEPVATAIFKDPVEGPVIVGETNLEGDRQADLRVHGGYYKAVYVYPSEHYDFWKQELPDVPFTFGMFGENLTTSGLLEGEVSVEDRLRIGTAEFKVTQPRSPCFKLNIRFGRDDMIKRFVRAGRSGFYLAIETPGELEAGDAIEIVSRAAGAESIASVVKKKFKLN
jgi:MOSC domain-containing protein YiiM